MHNLQLLVYMKASIQEEVSLQLLSWVLKVVKFIVILGMRLFFEECLYHIWIHAIIVVVTAMRVHFQRKQMVGLAINTHSGIGMR